MFRRYRVLLLLLIGAAVCTHAHAGGPVAPKLSVWVYRFQGLENDELLANLQRRRVARVFLSAPRSLLTQSNSKLREFVGKAHAAKIEVHAMTLEDPSFVRQENHPKAEREIEGLLSYCREHPEAAFDGIHVDAEPHVLFQGKLRRTADDWAANEALMKQYVALLTQTSRQVRTRISSGKQPLKLSAAIAWWYNERARDGVLPSGSAKLLGKHLDFVVPMVYDGIGGTAADVSRRIDDEVAEVPTVIGVARKEYSTAGGLDAAIQALNDRYARNPHFEGVSVFEYSRWFGVPRRE